MKNIITLQKDEDGIIYCQQITESGIEFVNNDEDDRGHWDEGGTIELNEIDEILNKEI